MTSQRAAALAAHFAAANSTFIRTVDVIPTDAWSTRDPATGWSVGATAHHVASCHTLYMGIANAIAQQDPVPEIRRAMLDRINAEHARDHRDADKRASLVLLLESGEKVQRAIARLDDDQLGGGGRRLPSSVTDRSVPGKFIDDWGIGHVVAHLSSLRGVAELYG